MRLYSGKIALAAVLIMGFMEASTAQDRKLGTWRMYLPYSSSFAVCDAGDKVYSAAQSSIFSYEKATGVIQTYDKSDGLSDVNVTAMAYDAGTKALVVAYKNSNIDLIFNGTDIYNIPDIKNKATTGAIAIYGISFYSGYAYISSDIGISTINLSKKEISNTYSIGANGLPIKVYSTSTDGNTIYAATVEGLKYAVFNSPNLQDFNQWTVFGPAQNLPVKPFSQVVAYNNKAYAVVIGVGSTPDTLYKYDGTSWTKMNFADTNDDSVVAMGVTNGNLYLSYWDEINFGGRNVKIDASGSMTTNISGHGRPLGWFEDNGISWEADLWNGLFKNYQGSNENIVPDGPYSTAVYGLNVTNGVLNLSSGGVDEAWYFTFRGDGFSILKDDKWHKYNGITNGAMNGVLDILSSATVQSTGKTYFASFFSGLVEFDNNTGNITLFNRFNSPLEQNIIDTQRTKVSCVTTDKYDNLWIANVGAPSALKMLKPGNATDASNWKSFSINTRIEVMKKILVDDNDQIWAPVRGAAGGLLVWSYNQTLDDRSDDAYRLLSTGAGQGALPDETVYCVAQDKDGNIWAGTNQGIGIFYCPGSVLTSNGCDADQIKVERDGYVGYLFGTESVRAIAVDAANRKWIGTTNGVWLISADGKTELLKFNIDNSPLPSNIITDIAINDITGEVYIGTINGLVSYQGDAMEQCQDCKQALVYPNPVKPDYSGPIAIKGLTDNAYVKITDVSGTLIYQGKANGSQMIWDGKGYNGARAKSGVYLVFTSTDLGKERKVAKILLAN